jgi:HAE1 family hydrophobic/amphiphilic exporter-1
MFGGTTRELRITIDPDRMARYGLTVTEIALALRQANASVSAGDVEEGKRRYVVRTDGELNTPERVAGVVLRSSSNVVSGRLGRVMVGDIADVAYHYKEPTARIRLLGEPALAVNAVRETGANVIQTMEGIREAVEELNLTAIPQARLTFQQVYDETIYIDSAIELVQQNIYVGGVLAALILLLFLRSFPATLIISIAIPVSVVGSFVAMALLGRSINVISLAGLAFAVGMVVDAAIVVLENIYRLRQKGYGRLEAAYFGARQVWGAVFVSAATTVLVFVPILVMELEAGQLFRDIAVAISVSVVLSLLVASTVIPSLASRILGGKRRKSGDGSGEGSGDEAAFDEAAPRRLRLPIIDDFAAFFVRGVLGFTAWVVRGRMRAGLVALVVCGGALFVSWQLLPKLDYLPTGNRNLVFGIVLPPPGYNLETTTGIARSVEDAVRPHWASETGPTSEPGEPPKMERFFFVTFNNQAFVGAVAMEPGRAAEMIDPIRFPVFREPGTFGFISQASLFGRGIGGGRKIDVDISGPDLEAVLGIALQATGRIAQIMPFDEGNQFRPRPGLELGAPEVRLIPNQIKLGDNGVSASELGATIEAYNDGLKIDEVTIGADRLDLILAGPEANISRTQGIDSLPVVTRSGTIVPASSLADITVTAGPTQIRHVERERTVTLEIRPAANIPLEVALEQLETNVVQALTDQGLPPGVKIRLSGTADDLQATWDAMVINLVIAIAIVYLIMAVLFESFVYPFIIMLSVPLATAGGVLGLAVVNSYTFQPLDMLTLLGFVILIGIVVNNAILLVHQTLFHIREEEMSVSDAIVEATRNRIRPIFMSTLTSVFGMLPLVLFPGAGSELYRGLGSVVIGGLALSAVLTLLIVPPLLAVVATRQQRKREMLDTTAKMPSHSEAGAE